MVEQTAYPLFTILFSLSVQAAGDPVVGTWELNLEKSKYIPGPPPRSKTRTYEVKRQKRGLSPFASEKSPADRIGKAFAVSECGHYRRHGPLQPWEPRSVKGIRTERASAQHMLSTQWGYTNLQFLLVGRKAHHCCWPLLMITGIMIVQKSSSAWT